MTMVDVLGVLIVALMVAILMLFVLVKDTNDAINSHERRLADMDRSMAHQRKMTISLTEQIDDRLDEKFFFEKFGITIAEAQREIAKYSKPDGTYTMEAFELPFVYGSVYRGTHTPELVTRKTWPNFLQQKGEQALCKEQKKKESK